MKSKVVIEPFALSSETTKLLGSYPSSAILRDVYARTLHEERLGIIRLWMTEGIPFAFKQYPLLYEEVRNFIARGITVEAKEVTLVGSGRIGFSLSKDEWGDPFNGDSDLDFVVVSDSLFRVLVAEFQTWVRDLASRKVLPRNEPETATWLENIEILNQKIPRGFIQVRLLPFHDNYPHVRRCYDTIWLLRKKLKSTATAPRLSDASIRVYSSWRSCVNQLRINFNIALNLWGHH